MEKEKLELDEFEFRRSPSRSRYSSSSHPQIGEFTVHANNTFRRYKESNQRIDTFRLRLDTEWYGRSGLATKWTLKALKLGATDLTFRLNDSYPAIFMAFDELFRCENVVRLCLETLSIHQGLEVIRCSGLTSLTLDQVSVPSDSFFNIISACPLIQNLSLSGIYTYTYYDDDGHCARIPDGSIFSLLELTSLVLSGVHEHEIQNLFLGDLSSKFPNLKELTLCLSFSCQGEEEEEMYFISSHSLEVLNFSLYKRCTAEHRVEFDIPSIIKFRFEGSHIPNMYFRSISMDQWEESRVSLTHNSELSTLWFCELSSFLTKLRGSKIHLCLHLDYKKSFDYQMGEIDDLDLCQVEDLTMDTEGLPCLSFNALLDGLFWICRPKTITQYASPPNSNDIFLCRALGQGMKLKRLLIISQFMLTLLDLEEINAEKLFGEEWTPQPLDSILDDSQRRFRFRLKWKPS